MEKKSSLVGVSIVSLIAIAVIWALFAVYSNPVDVSNLATKSDLNAVKSEIAGLKTEPVQNATDPRLTSAVDEILAKQDKENVALNVATDELNSKDSKKAIFELLNDNDASIEDYKDITKIVIKDSDASVRRESGSVDFELKVYYLVDGDSEETGKALIEATCDVSDLVVDDNFEDAESDCEFSFVKIYD